MSKRQVGHTTRTRTPRESPPSKILAIQEGIAEVEPGVTMERLAAATLKRGQIPKIVPEFRKITVGGAISGAALESSSHRFGLFHDTCPRFDLRDGEGTIQTLEAGPLFQAVPGAYGTLGRITRAEVELMPASTRLSVNYQTMGLGQAMERFVASDADYLDALYLGQERCVVMEGRLGRTASRFYQTKSHFFYQHAQQAEGEEEMGLLDYLFRYDRGAFWMGRYLCDPVLALCWLFKRGIGDVAERIRRCNEREPGPLFRSTLGRRLTTERLYRGLQAMPEGLRHSVFLVQDLCVPLSKLPELLEGETLRPIWLCPVKPGLGLFAPHALGESVVNVGIYGSADGWEETARLEQKLAQLGGRKALYSLCRYSSEQFWELYDRAEYLRLREEVKAEGVFSGIHELTHGKADVLEGEIGPH